MNLTPKQAAEQIGVSAGLVYQWCQEGRLPCYRFGGRGRRGRILIDPADLAAFIRAQKVDGSAAPPPAFPTVNGPLASPFSELDPRRLARAWKTA